MATAFQPWLVMRMAWPEPGRIPSDQCRSSQAPLVRLVQAFVLVAIDCPLLPIDSQREEQTRKTVAQRIARYIMAKIDKAFHLANGVGTVNGTEDYPRP